MPCFKILAVVAAVVVVAVAFSFEPRGCQLITNQNNEVEQNNEDNDECKDGQNCQKANDVFKGTSAAR